MKIVKLVFYILVIAALGITAYHYLHLDQNAALQEALKTRNVASIQAAMKEAVDTQVKAQATQYVYDNNGYFVSKSNNICVSLQKNLSILATLGNPLECAAEVHTFTARIKTLSDSYYCLDTSGFYTTSLTEAGYQAGVQCQ